MNRSTTEIESAINTDRPVHSTAKFVMEDALVGEVKELTRGHSHVLKLKLSILGAVAALVAVPTTYSLTFVKDMPTNSVSLRLTLLFPIIFLVIVIVLFSIFWTMRRWFSLWFIMIFAATLFVSACLSLLAR